MRFLIWLILTLSVSLANDFKCDTYSKMSHLKEDRDAPLLTEILTVDIPVFPNGEIDCKLGQWKYDTTNKIARNESGEHGGLKYRFYYTDGSGTIQGRKNASFEELWKGGWQTECGVDPIDNVRFCEMRNIYTVITFSNEKLSIRVGGKHYPVSLAIITVDNEPPTTSIENGAFLPQDSEALIKSMLKGSKATIRYQKELDENYTVNTIDIYNLDVAIEILKTIYNSTGGNKVSQ